MFFVSLYRWHPIRLYFYGFLAAAALGLLFCAIPVDGDPHLRIFRGLLAIYGGFLCAFAILVQYLRNQDDAVFGQLLARHIKVRGFDQPKTFSFEKTWFGVTASVVGLSLLVPLYALSKAILSWSELGLHDVVGCTCGMLVGLVLLSDVHFFLRRRLAKI